MNRQQLLALRRQLIGEMLYVKQRSDDGHESIGSEVATLISLRHLYDVVCRELDDADLNVGGEEYLAKIGGFLVAINSHRHDPEMVRAGVADALALVATLQESGGVR